MMGLCCQNTALISEISMLLQKQRSLTETPKFSSLPSTKNHLRFSLGGWRLSVVTLVTTVFQILLQCRRPSGLGKIVFDAFPHDLRQIQQLIYGLAL